MKKTTFQNIDFLVSTIYNRTYTDGLEADGIAYTTRTIPIFQSLLPKGVISYGGYEIGFKNENGEQTYVYSFITEKTDLTQCTTFFPAQKLDNLYLLDLEQALRTGQLIFEDTDMDTNRFKGFDFSAEIQIEDLLDKLVYLDDGSCYAFTTVNEFPEGIIGKKIPVAGEAINVFLGYFGAFGIHTKGIYVPTVSHCVIFKTSFGYLGFALNAPLHYCVVGHGLRLA